MTGADVRMNPALLGIAPAARHPFKGEWLSSSEIASKLGVSVSIINRRLQHGRPLDIDRRSGPPAKLYLFRGELLSATDISAIAGVSVSTVRRRVCGNTVMDDDEVRAQPPEPRETGPRYFYRGERLTVTEWSVRFGVPYSTLYNRLKQGWTIGRALTQPPLTGPKAVGRRNRYFIRLLVRRFRSVRNRLLIHRIASAFRTHTGGYDQTSPHTLGTGLGSRAVERGQYENPFPTENRRASA